MVMMASVLLALASLRASSALHIRLIGDVLRLPMVFFDTTPVGRLLNRFSKDVDVLDNTLPFVFRSWIVTFLQVWIIYLCHLARVYHHESSDLRKGLFDISNLQSSKDSLLVFILGSSGRR